MDSFPRELAERLLGTTPEELAAAASHDPSTQVLTPNDWALINDVFPEGIPAKFYHKEI